ncbi:hypothetical protein LZ012_02570 [Dechloromonas sp. XY25]|uniref:Uncharacterized protein n=1 Tax=Dechloromonas hankyongensis TaxID=2908002 RepID=A0ABS9JY87_9RHOO|nr:hypothetical protein [Dechloromonas hankyongensis]MCG2575876.1 hypothetical protein [Dechloromonas hankyongensis]
MKQQNFGRHAALNSPVNSHQLFRTRNALPNQLLEKVCASACLRHLPWLDMSIRPGEREYFEAWAKHRTVSAIRQLNIQEGKTFAALGPQGFWTLQEKRFGRWWRPHKLEEVFVEIMYPTWDSMLEKNPSYLIVISSGPTGSHAIYQNDQFQHLVTEENEKWLKDVSNRSIAIGQDGIERYASNDLAPREKPESSLQLHIHEALS